MWTPELGALRRELMEYVAAATARMFVWTLTATTSALGKEDAVQTGDDDQNRGQRPVRRVEPFGLRSRPPAKQRALSLRLGSSTVIYLGIASDGGYGPGDLEDGETAVYSKNVPKALHAMDSGDVAIASMDGQVVSLNGSDFALPKWKQASGAPAGFVVALKAFLASAKVATTAAQIATAAATFETAMNTASDFASTKTQNG